jgi:hypothetical protein
MTLTYSYKILFYIRRCIAIFALMAVAAPVLAWGDLGHGVVAGIADHYLEPAVRSRVHAILAGDKSHLTAGTDIESEATWADKYRDSDRNTTRVRYYATRNWHFVNLEIDDPNLSTACFGQPPPPGRSAAAGPAADCIVDKLEQFIAELKSARTSKKERLLALQFVLHFVGDLHQPLHASDEHDEGGNAKIVTGAGLPEVNLHAFWDVACVLKLGTDEAQITQQLIAKITPSNWAMESFEVAKRHAYGELPPASSTNHYELTEAYVSDATTVVAEQLSRAGVRLAYVLNGSLR